MSTGSYRKRLAGGAAFAALLLAAEIAAAADYPPLPPRRPQPAAMAKPMAPAETMQPAAKAPALPPAKTVVMRRQPAPPSAPRPPGPPDLSKIAPADLKREADLRKEPLPDPRVAMSVERSAERVVLGLGGADDRAAAFTRAGAHWIVIDRAMAVNIEPAIAAGLDVVQLPIAGRTVLHVRASDGRELDAWRTDGGWRFAIGAPPAEQAKEDAADAIAVVRRQSPPSRRRLSLEGMEGARLMRIADPEVGDAFFIAMVAEDRRVAMRHETPDAVLLETAAGVVVLPKAEGVGVSLRGELLEVRKLGGLKLSDPSRMQLSAGDLIDSRLDPVAWREGESDYYKGVVERLARVNGTAAFSRNAIRMQLARFSLGHGFAAEAIGYLETAARSSQGAELGPDFRAMRGVARAMLGQYDLAAKDLDDPGLDGDPHVELWRAAALANNGAERFAAAKFNRFWPAATEWPPRYLLRLTVAAGDSAVRAGMTDAAARFLRVDVDPKKTLPKAKLGGLAVIDGGVKAGRGDFDGAKAAYMMALKEGDEPSRAKAELALIELKLAKGDIDETQAADRLSKLQMQWRGDRTEFEALKRLGELRLATSEFRRGFTALSEASRVFGGRFDTTDVHAAMTAGFERAFVDGGVDGLPPLEAVALFEDFESLAPPGEKGDLALATLAGHLATLDLVDEADRLMSHLVRRRLTGPLRGRMGVELAQLRVSRAQWREALSTLDQLEDDMPDMATAERQNALRLRAEAVAGLGDVKRALKILMQADADDRETLALRARLAWRAGDWVSARAAYRDLAKAGAFDVKTLPKALEASAVRWAVAATMLKNEPEVVDVAARFADRLEDKALAAALKALAAPSRVEGEALAAARKAIDQADALADAVDDYRAARKG